MSLSHQAPPTDEVNDTDKIQEVGNGQSSNEDEEDNQETTPSNEPSSSSGGKKKKKKKSKALKLLSALKPQETVPQAIVDQVMQKVKADDPSNANVSESDVRKALDQLKLMEVLKGKSGLGGKNRKDMGEHKVCLVCFPCPNQLIDFGELVLGYTAGPTTR